MFSFLPPMSQVEKSKRPFSSRRTGSLLFFVTICFLFSGCDAVGGGGTGTDSTSSTEDDITVWSDAGAQADEGSVQGDSWETPVDLGPVQPICADKEPQQRIEEVLEVLEARCSKCHGKDGVTSTPTMPDITDLENLVYTGHIVPGAPSESPVYLRMQNSSMPPQGVPNRPDALEIQRVEDWIRCLEEKEPPKDFVSIEQIIHWIHNDITGEFQQNERGFIRYISLAHMYNYGIGAEDLDVFRQGLNKLVNSLSWNAKVTPLFPIDERSLVLRVDIRDYHWDSFRIDFGHLGTNMWNVVEEVYPYSVIYEDNDEAEVLAEKMGTEVLFIQGDWFAFNTAQPPLYHDVLGLPGSLAELQEMLGIDIQSNIDGGKVARAGFALSNVAIFNRLVERHSLEQTQDPEAPTGLYDGSFWISYDFGDNTGAKNLFQHPTNFVHDGNEVIFNLPNGLQAYFINGADDEGTRLDRAPTSIVFDPSPVAGQPDVTTGLSCMSCHYAGLKEANDEISQVVLDNVAQYPQSVIGQVAELHISPTKLQAKMDYDNALFEQALSEALVEPVTEREDEQTTLLAAKHFTPLAVEVVAASVGLTKDEFLNHNQIERLRDSRPEIANLVQNETGLLKREVFDETYRDIVCMLDLAKPINGNSGQSGCAFARLCIQDLDVNADATLEIDGVELQALNGKCSPCRAIPVGDTISARLRLVEITGNTQNVRVDKTITLTFVDETDYRLDLIPEMEGSELVDVEVGNEALEGLKTCENSF
jgi:hypothetical protein